MEILSPEDRVVLWRMLVKSTGQERHALARVVARDVLDSLERLNLYGDYEGFVVESLDLLDEASLLGRDELRLVLEGLDESEEGVELLASEVAALLREAAGVDQLQSTARLRALQLAEDWRTHVVERPDASEKWLRVADVAARYGVSTQAVYKWLSRGRIEGERRPGGGWRIPAAQFRESRVDRIRVRDLQERLIATHGERPSPSDAELARELCDRDVGDEGS
jgi:excisionase family DNA binding protein